MKTWIVLLTVFTTIFIYKFQAQALVDMNNASYGNTWTDMELPGSGYTMRILRAYKSRTLYNGMFGFGWCSEFETKLSAKADGSIKINECGDGQEVNFRASELTKDEATKITQQILSKMKADKKYAKSSSEFWKKMESDLFESSSVRANYAKQYDLAVPIKEGIKYMANGKEVENVIFAKGVYTRNLPDGTMQRFDTQGRLTHMYDKNNNFIKLEYEKNLLISAEDNNSRKFIFKYFPNKNKVQKITGPNSLVTEYKYNQQDDLIWNKNAWAKTDKHIYTYEYNEFHNLVKATWPDNTFIALKYDNVKDWVIGFTDREKCVEDYKYEFSKTNPERHYWATTTKTCDKKQVAKNKFEFWYKQIDNGQVILSRVLTDRNGNVRDVTYHDTFGKPVTIKINGDRTDFEYYSDGLAKIKSSANAKLEYTYDPKLKRVASVKTTFLNEKGKTVATRSSAFKYDDKGNLTYAENTDGQKINMTYDMKGRIQSITDQAKKLVKIEYEDRYGKPAIVTRPGLGTLKIEYKQNGDISKVDSPDGPTVASQVASTFNNLLDILAPATQELYL